MIDFKAIRARADAALPGPWRWDSDYGGIVSGASGLSIVEVDTNGPDREFVIRAREDVPALLSLVDSARRALLDLERPICTGTVLGEDQYDYPCCMRWKGWCHAVACELDQTLTALGLPDKPSRDEARKALGLEPQW